MATNGFDKRPQDINRTGKNKGSSLNLTNLLKRKLESVDEDSKKTFAKLFVDKIVKKAVKTDDIQAFKLIINYIDGLPKQTIDQKITGELSLFDVLRKIKEKAKD